MATIEQRIAALEKEITGGEELTVVIARFSNRPPGVGPSQYRSGEVTVTRAEGEDADTFQDRAIATLRSGRAGLVTVIEG